MLNNKDQDHTKPIPIFRWIISGALILITLNFTRIVIQNQDQIFGDAKSYSVDTYDGESTELGPKSKVIATLNNITYHLRGCPSISGVTEKMNYYAAINKSITPCDKCISDGL